MLVKHNKTGEFFTAWQIPSLRYEQALLGGAQITPLWAVTHAPIFRYNKETDTFYLEQPDEGKVLLRSQSGVRAVIDEETFKQEYTATPPKKEEEKRALQSLRSYFDSLCPIVAQMHICIPPALLYRVRQVLEVLNSHIELTEDEAAVRPDTTLSEHTLPAAVSHYAYLFLSLHTAAQAEPIEVRSLLVENIAWLRMLEDFLMQLIKKKGA